MSRPNSTSSFDEGQSADSGIGSSPCPSRSPLNAAELARSASCSYPEQSGESHQDRIQSEYRAIRRLPVETPNKSLPHNGVHFADQVAVSSWPASTPSLGRDGRSVNTRDSSVPTRPQTPYPFQRKADVDEISDSEDTEKVLTPPKGKNTPTLMNAPKLQWDFTKPLFVAPSQSTMDSGEGVEESRETETEQCGISEAKGNIVRAGTPIPSLAPPIETGHYHKTNGVPPARTHQVYTIQRPSPPTPEEQPPSPESQIPSLLRVLDANLHPQPHLLSPLAEHDEQSNHTQSCEQLSDDVSCIVVPSQSPLSPSPSPISRSRQARIDDDDDDDEEEEEDANEPEHSICSCPDQSHRSRPRTNTQRTRETDPYPFNRMERVGLQTAQVLPAQYIDRVDWRCGEVTIPHRCGGSSSVEADKRCLGRGSRKKRFGVRVRVKMSWVRIKGLFCRRRT